MAFTQLLLLVSSFCASFVVSAPASSLPIVDLGYERHQAAALNASTGIYNFTNIRFAQPPVGNLRWMPPVAPTGRNAQVQNGGNLQIWCPQAAPAWGLIAANFSVAWIEGKGNDFNFNASYAALLAMATANPAALSAAPDPRQKEDCLFLNVFAPQAGFNKTLPATGKGGAAVLVWIYGGGYTEGFKGGYSLSETLQQAGSEEFIFVEMNYRLGAFGFLSGPTLQAAGGVSNAGFYDQRAALEWVQKYIHLFGGDPSRVTVMGESAGGGSVLHQITAYGGLEPAPFAQALPQSAAWLPVTSNYLQENITESFLGMLGVDSIEAARQLPTEKLIQTNYQQVLLAPYGKFVYGPTVDGVFVPAQPGQLLQAGAFDKNVTVMVGHNAHEGVTFTDPRIKTDDDLIAFIETGFPGIQPSVVQQILELYPAVYNGSYPWMSPIDRTIDLISEAFFTCPSNWLDRALGNKTYAYEFEVPPALHGQDISYTFYNGQGTAKNVINATVIPQIAEVHQKYIANFVTKGNPNGNGAPNFPQYGISSTEETLNVTGIKTGTDPTENPRCVFWQQALYY